MIDGKIAPDEWSDAFRFRSNDITVYAKQHEHYLLIAIRSPSGSFGFTDLLLGPRGARIDLHASAKLGQRAERPDGSWGAWRWWHIHGWVANVARVRDFSGPILYPENVREYEIDETVLPRPTVPVEIAFTRMRGDHILSTSNTETVVLDINGTRNDGVAPHACLTRASRSASPSPTRKRHSPMTAPGSGLTW